MAQRILEPGEIETLAAHSIPRVRIPDRTRLFAKRAERLRTLAATSPIGDYLRLFAVVADAQHAAVADFPAELPGAAQIEMAQTHRMPPIAAASWPRAPQWRATLQAICAAAARQPHLPAPIVQITAGLRDAAADELEAQADILLGARDGGIDAAAAPFLMAALQVNWLALASRFAANEVKPIDVPGLCPLCGSLPVSSIVATQTPYQGYRYLHCALCACEWHMVRVQCSQCGAAGKDIAYRSLASATAAGDAAIAAAVRAETCEHCHSYRKILYQEKDPGVEPVADDLASIALDLLLAEAGYARASGNPLLWQPAQG
ncbi:formate dehydrogenase accessory protein FdhE [Rudaea sp.]|uniref:formate dehydrogenase accessory protein FdhE n=1 Tax=Rudaea sp. TaxID=2136325 RepID=UPI00321FE2F8